MQKNYRILETKPTLENIIEWIREAPRERIVDLDDYDEQEASNVKIYNYTPSSSSDLIGTEKVGDIAADTNFLYVVVDNSGTLQWQRVATSTF